MAGQRGLHGRLGRGAVADLAHHDHLGILPHEEPQTGRQIESRGRIDLRLGNARHGDLDGIFQRDEAPRPGGPRGQFAQAGVDGRRLSAAGRPRDENGPRRLAEQLLECRQDVAGQAQIGQPLVLPGAAEEPHDGTFAVERGERAQPHFDVAVAQADAAFLGRIGAIGEQFGLDLQAGDNVGGQCPGDQGQGLEHAVDAEFGIQSFGGGLQVQIAGAGRAAGGQ